MRTVTVRNFEALAPHRSAWDRLAWEAPQMMQTLLPAWVEASLRTGLTGDDRWLCSFAYAGTRLVGVFPAIVASRRTLGGRRSVLQTCSDRLSPSGDIALAPDQAGVALQALLAEIRREEPTHLGIDFKAVRQNSPLHAVLQDGVDGYLILNGRRSLHSVLDVRGDFASYLAPLKSMRRNLKRFRRRLEDRGNLTVEIQSGSQASDQFLPEFLALEALGWKGRSGTAILHNPDLELFFADVVKRFAEEGRLEWHIMRLSGRPVAAQLAFRCGAALVLAKWAFNEDFADCRLGTLLTEETLKEAFARPEISEINTMSTAQAYGLWRMSQEQFVDKHLVRVSALPLMSHLPVIAMRSAYQEYLRPWIPAAVRNAWREFRGSGDQKPRRAADVRRQHPQDGSGSSSGDDSP